MRIVHAPFINHEATLTGWHFEGRSVSIDATIKGKPAQLVLSEDEARGLKAALEQSLVKLVASRVQ